MTQLSNTLGCTIETCSLIYANILYIPSLEGNVLYLAIFAVLFFIQAFQLWRYPTWSFSFSMMAGLALEVIGYLGRVQMHFNPFAPNPFMVYVICLTIGPVFFSAAIYLTLSRIIVYYGIRHARISPKAISLTFMICDFIALVLQATGGTIADNAATEHGSLQGTHIMVGGLAFQVFSLLLFIALATEFALNVWRDMKAEEKLNFCVRFERGLDIAVSMEDWIVKKHNEKRFKQSLFAWALATIFILVRSCFRVAELTKGFGSKLANQQVLFMILEGAMIVLATTTMTYFHPGYVFSEKWEDAGWSWKKAKKGSISKEDVEATNSSDN